MRGFSLKSEFAADNVIAKKEFKSQHVFGLITYLLN